MKEIINSGRDQTGASLAQQCNRCSSKFGWSIGDCGSTQCYFYPQTNSSHQEHLENPYESLNKLGCDLVE